jgi:hypothetical protein
MHEECDFDTRIWNLAQGGQDAVLERHIATCDACQEELSSLRHLAGLRLVAGGPLADVPPEMPATLSNLLSQVRPDLVPQPQLLGTQLSAHLRRITATLLHDTGLSPQVAGLRSGGDRRTRQLAFVSDVADLDLEVSRVEDEFAVTGQLGMDSVPESLNIRFVPADQDPLETTRPGGLSTVINEDGYFRLTLAPGEWVAAVDLDDAVVLFPGVRL